MSSEMATRPDDGRRAAEPPGDRARRILAETQILAQVDVDIDKGLGTGDGALEAWLDQLDRVDAIDKGADP